jgi:threonine dehydrogenase-like Zn-dependent dehydrogenase
MTSMRAALVTGPAKIEVVDIPVPQPQRGQVLVRVMAYAPYGTDVGVYLNRYGRYVSQYPVGIGADFSGIVHAIGEGVTNVNVGDRVCALSLDHCQKCANCKRGKTNLCLDPAFAKVPRQACCQEYTIVSACKLARMPDEVSFEDGAMLAGVVDALNAYEKFGVTAGDHVVVVGVGAMGHSAIAAAVALGCEVTALGGTGKRADMALQLGAKRVLRLRQHNEDVSQAALEIEPHGFPFVIETTASEWGLRQAFAIAGMDGAVAVTGGTAQLGLTGWDMVQRELRIFGIRAGHHQEQALGLIQSGRIDLKPTITARFPLARVAEAFELLTGERAADVSRVMIQVCEE